jgi:hypothetical protein
MRPPSDRPVPVPERTGVLVIRVWLEQDGPGRLRARLLQGADPSDTTPSLVTAAGVPGICAAVEAWLERFLDSPER